MTTHKTPKEFEAERVRTDDALKPIAEQMGLGRTMEPVPAPPGVPDQHGPTLAAAGRMFASKVPMQAPLVVSSYDLQPVDPREEGK